MIGWLSVPITLFILFVICVLGAMLTYKSEEIYKETYNLSWHLMSLSDQKSFKIILIFAKDIKTLSAGLQTLNFETFYEVCNFKIY